MVARNDVFMESREIVHARFYTNHVHKAANYLTIDAIGRVQLDQRHG